MSNLEIFILVGSLLVGFIVPAFISGSIPHKVTFGIALGLLYAVTMMIIK